MSVLIMEESQELEVSEDEALKLANSELVYLCDDPEHKGLFHISLGKSWESVEAELDRIRLGVMEPAEQA